MVGSEGISPETRSRVPGPITWIALLRGINVGGHNTLPMAALRSQLEMAGFEAVRTYIQSGNCVFETGETQAVRVAARIEEAIESGAGFRPAVTALTAKNLSQAVAANPLPDDDRCLHLFFLAAVPAEAALQSLEALRKPSERIAIAGRVLYLHAPEGIGRSRLAAQAERKLAVSATARNLRTVKKLLELAQP